MEPDSGISDGFDEAVGLLKLAREAADESVFERAIVLVDEALALHPELARAWVAKSRFLQLAKRLEDAIEAVREGLRIDESWFGWLQAGKLFYEQYDSAELCFAKVVSLNDGVAKLYTELAHVQLVIDPAKSVTNAQKALELLPGWEDAKNVLRSARREIRRLETKNTRDLNGPGLVAWLRRFWRSVGGCGAREVVDDVALAKQA